MKLAILHYHLNRGGVTRVIESQLRALDAVLEPHETWHAALFYGGRRVGWPEDLAAELQSIRLSLHEVPLLDYDSDVCNERPPTELLHRQLTGEFAQLGFAPGETVLHVHNHALGKNAALPAAVAMLAGQGYAMVLEPHDFAEDFRAANFQQLRNGSVSKRPDSWHGWIYPQSPHVHYAVLNGRDYGMLSDAGVDAGRLHLLPNPVRRMDRLPAKDEARRRLSERFGVATSDRFVLYPVRGIRRKNVGEAVLYSVLAEPGTVIGLTLPPMNPAEQEIHALWKKLAAELELPCRFELGAPGGMNFAESLAAADLFLTTSVAEGFGMVFLESWLAGRGLVGRDLPEITPDFTKVGVRLDALEPSLRVPLEWVGADLFRQTVLDAYRKTLAAYRRAEPPGIMRGLEEKTEDGLVDFGDLDEPLQQEVIRIVASSDADRRRLLDCNAWIEQVLSVDPSELPQRIQQNVAAIEDHFSLVPSGRRLVDLYRQTAASASGNQLEPLPHAGRLLDRFLDPRRFRLIRS